jgi:hypothetical protein
MTTINNNNNNNETIHRNCLDRNEDEMEVAAE